MNNWKADFESLLKNNTYTIKELKQETQRLFERDSIIDVSLFCFCLLRDNCLCLKSRLIVLLILESIACYDLDLSTYLHEMIGDIYDESKSIIERTICSWILIGSLDSHEELQISNLVESVQRMEEETFQSPSISVKASDMIMPSIIRADQYPDDDIDIQSYSTGFMENPDLCLFSLPSFSRPTISFAPVRDELLFLSPLVFSPTFLYAPLQHSQTEVVSQLISQSFDQVLSESELQMLRSDITGYLSHLQNVISTSSITNIKLRSLVSNNPVIAADLIRLGLSSSKKQQLLDWLLQIPLTLQLLHVVSQVTPIETIPSSFLASFVDRSIKGMIASKDDGSQTHLIQCFCFFLAGLYKNNKVEKTVLQDATNKLKENYISIPEVACLISLVASGFLFVCGIHDCVGTMRLVTLL